MLPPILLAPILLALVSLACFGSFAWGVARHFRRDGDVPPGMRMLSYGSLAAFAWFLVRLRRDGVSPAWPFAILLMLGSLALFWWAVASTRARRLTLAFERDAPVFLHQDGPYRYVRHPFYGAYMAFWVATSLSGEGKLQWLTPAILCGAYVVAARLEERKFAGSPLSSQYRDYRCRTGMMLPVLWRRNGIWAILRRRAGSSRVTSTPRE